MVRELPTTPSGSGVSIARHGAGFRVTLRPHVGGRGLVRRCWAVLSAWGLAGFIGASWLALSAGSAGASFLDGVVLVLLWTLAGLAVLAKGVYAARGRDVLDLEDGEWTVWRGSGLFGVAHRFPCRSVQGLRITHRHFLGIVEDWVEATVDGNTLELASLGSTEELQWLLDLLQRERSQYGPRTQEVARAGAETRVQPYRLPRGWRAQPMADNGVRVVLPRRHRMGSSLCVGATCIWNWIALQHLVRTFKYTGDVMAILRGSWVPVGTGLALLGVSVRLLLAKEEWRADRDRLLVIRTSAGTEHVEYFRGGSIALVPSMGERSTSWSLVVRSDGNQQLLARVGFDGKLSELRDVAVLLARHTGWPLEVPPEAGE